jgi:hypothetical protein
MQEYEPDEAQTQHKIHLTMGTRFIKNYKLEFCTSLTNTTAGELLRKCVNKGEI